MTNQSGQPLSLVVFSGLPGTGKSTLAEAAARLLGCPVFAKDELEATLRRSGFGPESNSSWAANDLLTTLAQGELRRGRSAVLDCVARAEGIRAPWRDLATRYDAAFRIIECVCSDAEMHRTRLLTRVRGIPGWYEVSWDEVELVRAAFEPWQDDRLVVDAVLPLEQNLATLEAYLGG